MADVDSLDVHGVRYAEIYTGLKRDMKLGGMSFVALIDFTTVDTMRASLERVIAEKSGQETKIDAMCYYKKRRRGAVMIRTQRDVMLACCEYPLVTSAGKPSAEPYIRVGVYVHLEGISPPVIRHRDSLKANLNVSHSQGQGHGLIIARSVSLAHGQPNIPKMRSLLGAGKAGRSLLRTDLTTKTQTFILDDQPPAKKVCLDSNVEWAFAVPGKTHGTVEIRPIENPESGDNPDLNVSPPELPVLIKEEPLDPSDPSATTKNSKSASENKSQNDDHEDRGDENEHKRNSDNQNDTSSMEDEDEDEQIPLVICPKDQDNSQETQFKQMWDQIKKMESRLNYVDQNKISLRSSSRNDQDDASGSSEDISAKIANLEQRLYSMEKGKEESDAPLLYLGDRLSKVEKNVNRILSSVDKLSKSIAMLQRKQVKSNTAVDVVATSLKELSESQMKTCETLEKINMLLEKNIA